MPLRLCSPSQFWLMTHFRSPSCDMRQTMIVPLTHSPTHPLTHPLTHSPTHPPTPSHTHTHTHTWCSFTKVMCVSVGIALVLEVVRYLESLDCPLALSSHTPGPINNTVSSYITIVPVDLAPLGFHTNLLSSSSFEVELNIPRSIAYVFTHDQCSNR